MFICFMIDRKSLVIIFLVVASTLSLNLPAQDIFPLTLTLSPKGRGEGEGYIQFNQHIIETKGSVDNIILRDINGDGMQEIILQQGKDLHIYNLIPQIGKTTLPETICRLPSDVCVYDIVKSNVVYINDKGVNLLPIIGSNSGTGSSRLQRGSLQESSLEAVAPLPQIIRTSTIFKDNNFISPLYRPFIFDISDKYQTAIIPTLNGFSFYCSNNILSRQGYLIKELSLPLSPNVYQGNSIFEPLTVKMNLPPFVIEDLNNDKNRDFITLVGNEVQGMLLEENDNSICFRGIGNLFEQKQGDSPARSFPLSIRDLNNDGCADAVDIDISEGVIYIYLNQFPLLDKNKEATSIIPFWRDTPTQIIRTNKWIISHSLIDLNNDSLEDLIVLQMDKVGIIGGLQAIMAKALEWEMAVYLSRKSNNISIGIYPQSPDYIRRIKVPFAIFYAGPVSFRAEGFSIPYIGGLEGDFNGDKIKDLLIYRAKEGTIEIYSGNKQDVFSKSISSVISLSSIKKGFNLHNNIIISDLNNDGKSDIIIPFIKDSLSRYEIFLSY
ncbi:MAG: VCBS repeat-containing protein [Planctomycetota bacterium]|nr:VCBS repeat-containing protein [Planctomycetota bacterium]MDI6787544.1 VCBS repeat-containing protein [Planctomycetota bacterium]